MKGCLAALVSGWVGPLLSSTQMLIAAQMGKCVQPHKTRIGREAMQVVRSGPSVATFGQGMYMTKSESVPAHPNPPPPPARFLRAS